MKRAHLVLLLALAGCSGSKSSGAGDAGQAADAAIALDVALPPASRIPSGTRAVAFNEFSGDVAACASGWGHANICCEASLSEAPACFAAVSPFLPCPAGWLTYPDASRCCALDGDNACVSSSAGDAGVDAGEDRGRDGGEDAGDDGGSMSSQDAAVDGGRAESCYEPCSPGSWLDADGNCCWGRGTVASCLVRDRCSGSWEACQAILGAHSTLCAACPEGWSAPKGGQAALCCRATPSAQCFSQAKTIPAARLGSGRFCIEPPGKGTCRCETTGADWSLSVLACDKAASPVCTFTVDGVAMSTTQTWCGQGRM